MYPQIRKMSLGIPGVAIEDNISFLPKYKNLEGTSLVRELKEQFEIECYVENDLNAMVLSEVEEMESFAHIAYIDGCVGVGIALFGKLWKGYQGYAGETEFLCSDITNVKSVLVDNILALTCVLNLPRIYLSGEEPDEDSIHFVKEELEKRLPKERIPQFVLVKDREKLYQEGLISMIVCQWEQTE